MFKKLIYTFSLVLVLSVVMTIEAQADLVAWWRFEEGSGDTASDNSGNGHNGTLLGTPEWGVGAEGSGGAVVFNPDGCVGVDCGIFDPTDGTGQFSLALWAFWDGTGTFQHFLTKSNGWGATTMMFQVELWGAHTNSTYTDRVGVSYDPAGSMEFSIMPKNEWVHLTWTFDGTDLRVYVNGVDEVGPKPFSIGPNVDATVFIGVDYNGGRIFEGLLDEVRIYSHALSQVEIMSAMKGEPWPYAFGPDPEDGALNLDTWANLNWSAGDFAVSHDVYLGDNFDDVSNGTPGAPGFRGNQAGTSLLVGFPGFPFSEGLVPGTTYYWRIDEVNETDPNSPWRGDVWSFSIPPRTAYYPDPADGAESVDVNVELSWTAGFGAKLHTAYFGDNFDDVNNAAAGAPRGTDTYTPGPLEVAKTYYWRVDEFDSLATHKGDVWSFTTEGAVGSPNPSNGAVDVKPTTILSWNPGVLAASHEVYFGTDADVVKAAAKTSPEFKGTRALGDESYDPGKLELETTYYWRIDEVNSVHPDSPWIGNVWSFATGRFLVVDDFESYNDIDPPDPASNRIFDKWIDGFGTTTNGALAGNDLPPYAEQTVVHGGAQSLVYRYDNAAKTSEATLALVYPRDWTEEGVAKLSLWVRGDGANAADQIYVALNGTAVVYHDDASATQLSGWNEWVIELSVFGVDLTNVNTITIGIGTKNAPLPGGGQGTMYFDDIRLYRPG
ncbi:MAG: LamG domain-containing protein [Phycisphaerae bacterium]|nr:LamG domain-containing protein [Phycisphaerae bacterium]